MYTNYYLSNKNYNLQILENLVKDKVDWYLDELVYEMEQRIGKSLDESFSPSILHCITQNNSEKNFIFLHCYTKQNKGVYIISADIMEKTDNKYKNIVYQITFQIVSKNNQTFEPH